MTICLEEASRILDLARDAYRLNREQGDNFERRKLVDLMVFRVAVSGGARSKFEKIADPIALCHPPLRPIGNSCLGRRVERFRIESGGTAMKRIFARVPAILGILLLSAVQAQEEPPPRSGVDLTRIDRTLQREPAYQSDEALYCLLVFGAEGKTRVWLAVDGETLYVDRNGNGDLTEPGEAVTVKGGSFDAGSIQDADGLSHSVHMRTGGERARLWVRVKGLGKHYVGTDPAEPLQFAYRPEEAPIVRLGGPLTMRFYNGPPKLSAGDRSRINAMIGSEGLGRGTFAALECRTVLDTRAEPVADIAFPHRDPRRGPILVRVPVADD